MKKLLTLLAVSTTALLSHYALASATVTAEDLSQHRTVKIDNVASLSALVTHPDLAQGVWWPGAIIATPAATRTAMLDKQLLLNRLESCAANASPEDAHMLRSVKQQLQDIRVTGRQFVSLDPDVVRTKAGADRRLEGEYSLYTYPRPSTVRLMGAVSGAGKLTWQPGAPVSRYLEGHQRLSGGNKSEATVIHPDGHTSVVPVAYWNARHREAEPGSILWVGFDGCSSHDAAGSLSDDIISLLTRRIPD